MGAFGWEAIKWKALNGRIQIRGFMIGGKVVGASNGRLYNGTLQL